MVFKEIFKMVKNAVDMCTYAGCTNNEILKAATQIYCKQMEVESNANVKRQSDSKEAGEAFGS